MLNSISCPCRYIFYIVKDRIHNYTTIFISFPILFQVGRFAGSDGVMMMINVFWNGWLKKINRALSISWWMSLSYRNQSIDLQNKSMEWFLYDRDVPHERVNFSRDHCRRLCYILPQAKFLFRLCYRLPLISRVLH